ncbi:MAG: flagellin [bacterium]|nr:flagellin [bacterium]
MPLRINTNTPALNARRILNITGKDMKLRMERLSSGLRVNRASDDAAGLSVSEGLRAEISGFAQGMRNAEQATNLIQTAEGALGEMNGILLRMRELAVQSASSTVNDSNRQAVNAEFTQLVSELDRIAQVTSYNNTGLLTGFGNTVSQNIAVSTALASTTTGVVGVQITGATSGSYVFVDSGSDNQLTLGNGVTTQTLTSGSFLDSDAAGGVVATGSSVVANFDRLGVQLTLSGQKVAQGLNPATDGYRDGDLNNLALVIDTGTGGTFQVGPDDGAVHRLEVNINDMTASGANLNLGSLSVSTLSSSQSAILSIDLAIKNVTKARGDLGAVQNRLAFSIQATGVMLENDQASDASIRDADIALEVSAFSRSQILNQSGLAMLAQANVLPAAAINLL